MADLFPTYTLGDLPLTSYPFAVEFGGDHGAPETVTELTQTLLADGDLVTLTRHGNREISLVVHVEGPSLGELAANEATLRAECTKVRNDLVFQPGDFDSPASVFEVFSVAMKQPRDDEVEQHLLRRWELVFTCSPFPKSEAVTTVSALPSGGSPSSATIDSCDSALGWTATRSGAPVSATTFWEAGAVGAAELDSSYTAPETWTLTRTGPMDFSVLPYLQAEVRTVSYNGNLSVRAVTSTGTALSLPILSKRNLEAGGDEGSYHEVVCLVPGGVTLASVTFVHTSQSGDIWQGLLVRRVGQSNMPPGGFARQTSQVFEVGGTERTPASLRASTTAGFLGTTLIHTTKFDGSGYSPDMRRWRATGNATSVNADARKITGTWELMRPDPVVSRTPSHSMPRGNYLLVAAIKSDTVATTAPLPISWAVKSVISGQTLGNDEGTGYGWFPVAHELTIIPIASLAAPIVRSGALDVEVHLFNPTSTVTMHVEQWWMFTDDDDSALSIVNTSEGALWLDSPDADSPVPTVWVGPSKPLSFHPAAGLVAQGSHTFRPGPTLVTTVSDSNDYMSASLEYRKRWHSNAAE